MFLYTPDPVDLSAPISTWMMQNRNNFKKLEACDAAAKAAGSLVGRYFYESVADGKAFYQIIRENKRTVRIRACKGIGDDYTVSIWGNEASIPKTYALQQIHGREALAALFSKQPVQA